MELTITIPPQALAVLQRRAAAKGVNLQEVASTILADELLSPTLDELLAPIRQAVEDSGTTEDELDEFMYSLRKKVKTGIWKAV